MVSLGLFKRTTIAWCLVLLLTGKITASLWAADEIKLGLLSTGGDHWPIWVALDQGFLKEQKLDVREFQTDSVAKAVQALSANSTDLLFPSNTQGIVVAMSKGAAIKVIAGDYTKALYDLITGPKYKKLEDLKGGTMGVINLTSGSTVLLQKMLAAHGLKYPGDYDLLTVGGTPSRYAAVKKGAVAAAMSAGPAISIVCTSLLRSSLKPSIASASNALVAPAPLDHTPNFLPLRSDSFLSGESFRTQTSCIEVSPPPMTIRSLPSFICSTALSPA